MIDFAKTHRVSIIFISFFIIVTTIFAQISTTPHNLSVSGPGLVKSPIETEICLFCHTPHNGSRIPLWNRNLPGVTYTLYNSSTFDATPGQPDGNSILCLSCHDGTVALGSVLTRPQISFGINIYMPSGPTNLTTDLSDDHPISFEYTSSLALIDGQLLNPSNISPGISLQNNKVQCTSCHDPHKNNFGNFLVLSAQQSILCKGCHSIIGWSSAGHNTNTRMNNAGCNNCHTSHNALRHPRLLVKEESDACFDCHNGGYNQRNLYSIFQRPYSHYVANYYGVHDPTESLPIQTEHVECVDCHNTHQSDQTLAVAPYVKGKNKGVSGIDTDGNPIRYAIYTYQICYKCHSTSLWRPTSRTLRQIEQNNVALEFDPTAASYHPVETTGRSNDVPSLIPPWTTTSMVYCNECHSSNAVGLPDGPHGSIYRGILIDNYLTADYTNESQSAYGLCYRCHSRTNIRADVTFKHDRHVRLENTPCNACHDPHGISSSQGNTTNNSRLINFDLGIVSPYNGVLRFRDLGYRTGDCTLVCHGVVHNDRLY